MKCLVILVVTLVTIANGYPHDVKSFAEAEQQRQNKMESLEQMLKDFLDELKQSTKQDSNCLSGLPYEALQDFLGNNTSKTYIFWKNNSMLESIVGDSDAYYTLINNLTFVKANNFNRPVTDIWINKPPTAPYIDPLKDILGGWAKPKLHIKSIIKVNDMGCLHRLKNSVNITSWNWDDFLQEISNNECSNYIRSTTSSNLFEIKEEYSKAFEDLLNFMDDEIDKLCVA